MKKKHRFFHNTDYADPYDIDSDIIVVRCSINRSTMGVSDIVNQFSYSIGRLERTYTGKKRSIGFCGFPYTHPTRSENLKELEMSNEINLTDITHNISFIIIDEKSREITLDLVILLWRNCYKKNRSLLQEKNFVRSFIEIYFYLGRGNYSIRFYETLRAESINGG